LVAEIRWKYNILVVTRWRQRRRNFPPLLPTPLLGERTHTDQERKGKSKSLGNSDEGGGKESLKNLKRFAGHRDRKILS